MKCFKRLSHTYAGKCIMLIFFLVSLCLSACRQADTGSERRETISGEAPEEGETVQQFQESSCKFDQTEQTDDFISQIPELQGYEWDDKEKTAELILNDHWRLSLKRGGCDYFELSATFSYDRSIEIEENKKMIFDQVKWITSLIDEFDSEQIAEAIDNDKLHIQKVNEGEYFINFTDERLYEYYQFTFKTGLDFSNFKIGKYID